MGPTAGLDSRLDGCLGKMVLTWYIDIYPCVFSFFAQYVGFFERVAWSTPTLTLHEGRKCPVDEDQHG